MANQKFLDRISKKGLGKFLLVSKNVILLILKSLLVLFSGWALVFICGFIDKLLPPANASTFIAFMHQFIVYFTFGIACLAVLAWIFVTVVSIIIFSKRKKGGEHKEI